MSVAVRCVAIGVAFRSLTLAMIGHFSRLLLHSFSVTANLSSYDSTFHLPLDMRAVDRWVATQRVIHTSTGTGHQRMLEGSVIPFICAFPIFLIPSPRERARKVVVA